MSSEAGRVLGLLFGAVFAISCSDPKPSAAETTNARRADPPAVSASAASSSAVAGSDGELGALRADQRGMAVQIRTPTAPSKADGASLEKEIKTALPDVPLGGAGAPSGRLELHAAGELPEIPAMYYERLDPLLQSAVRTRSGIFFGAALDQDKGLKRLRAFEAVVLQMVKKHGGAIWDESMHAVLTPEAWEGLRVASWEGDLCDAATHMRIRQYAASPDRFRAITYGLSVMGLPELVIDDVPPPHSDQAALLIEAAAQTMVEGAELTATGQLDIDLAAIKHTASKKGLFEESTKPGRLVIKLKPAKKEADDPEGRVYAFDFSAFPGATPGEQLGSALTTLFGPVSDEPVMRSDDDKELTEAAKRVQAKVPELAARAKKGIPPGEVLLIKAPFDTDDDSVEWMWVDVTSWDKGTARGHLANRPTKIKGLMAGAKVEVPQAKIADYLWKKSDGTSEGGESIEILKDRKRGQ
ncbi:MAG: DUF2314 domain-containing protein [Polyangiaceae bacterium]|nr:DUF2314 domain-containing protein [Polyangiaceae bacterium]